MGTGTAWHCIGTAQCLSVEMKGLSFILIALHRVCVSESIYYKSEFYTHSKAVRSISAQVFQNQQFVTAQCLCSTAQWQGKRITQW